MSVTNFPDGVKIGPDASGTDRLPLYEFDEYSTDSIVFGTMAANAHQTIVVTSVPNVRAGASIFARLMNPSYLPHLLVQHCWASANNEVSVMVRNLHTSSVAFQNDSLNFTIFNTSAP